VSSATMPPCLLPVGVMVLTSPLTSSRRNPSSGITRSSSAVTYRIVRVVASLITIVPNQAAGDVSRPRLSSSGVIIASAGYGRSRLRRQPGRARPGVSKGDSPDGCCCRTRFQSSVGSSRCAAAHSITRPSARGEKSLLGQCHTAATGWNRMFDGSNTIKSLTNFLPRTIEPDELPAPTSRSCAIHNGTCRGCRDRCRSLSRAARCDPFDIDAMGFRSGLDIVKEVMSVWKELRKSIICLFRGLRSRESGGCTTRRWNAEDRGVSKARAALSLSKGEGRRPAAPWVSPSPGGAAEDVDRCFDGLGWRVGG
jgi:hypothetical protein